MSANQCNLSTPKDTTATHILVFPTSATAQVQDIQTTAYFLLFIIFSRQYRLPLMTIKLVTMQMETWDLALIWMILTLTLTTMIMMDLGWMLSMIFSMLILSVELKLLLVVHQEEINYLSLEALVLRFRDQIRPLG